MPTTEEFLCRGRSVIQAVTTRKPSLSSLHQNLQEGVEGDHAPVCLGGRGAAPPEFCGGPTGYRLMLKRQREGVAMSDPVRLEAGVQMLAEACPGQSARTWDLLHTVLEEGFQSIDRRLHELGPLQPDRFSLKEANARLSELAQRWRLWP